MAERSKVHPVTVSKWERGLLMPDEEQLAALGVLYKFAPHVLRYGDVDLAHDESDETGAEIDAVGELPPPLTKAFRALAHEVEREAHQLGASIEDMDYIRASLADPETMVSLLADTELDRPLTDVEQREELEALKDELLAWVKRRVELRVKRKSRG